MKSANPILRFLPFLRADGPHNMAADEVLLESAVAGTGSLRFYGWATATLSLGYFQPHGLRRSDDRLAKLPLVRRPTGGGALVHHHELTYALALPASLLSSPPLRGGECSNRGIPPRSGGLLSKQRHQSWLCRMHTIIARSLSSLGVSTATVPEEKKAPGPLCFHHFTPGDLVLDAAKVVGSAQRKQRGALLQHGAILLATSPHAPALPGIRELTGRSLTPGDIIPVVEQEFSEHTGCTLTAGDWTVTERERVEELVQIKYSRANWNEKR